MKNFFIVIFRFITGFIREITTFLREGDKDSPFSSRRLFASAFVIAFIYSVDIALRKFTDLLQYGWIAALVFIPSVLCAVFAVIFSYFASVKDFRETIETVGETITGKLSDISLPHEVSSGEKIGAEGYHGSLPDGAYISAP